MERVLVERRGGVAWLRMNRPESLNAWDRSMSPALVAALEKVAGDDSVRAVVLSATGRSFCTGLDTKMLGAGDLDTAYFGGWHDVFNALEALDVPLIIAARGHCLGGGLALVLCGDYRVAAEDAVLGFSAVRGTVGVPPALTYRLAEIVGAVRARRLALFAEYLGAEEALRMGLVDAVVPTDRLDEAASGLAERVCENSPLAVRETKRLLRSVSRIDVDAAQKAVLEATGRCLDAIAAERRG
ncbi:MAG TPA: enoyl-CoA hydratase/isomerase family protein [Candidatus Dormibacteraeota bacterium]|nr:enoyl-CoA hydratase/isomerase family protein [Candidatus Dormibacteraeota bacterium]